MTVWAGISWKGKADLVVVNGTVNANDYVEMLEKNVLPFRDEYYPNRFIFQQDNALAHSAKLTREFFATEGILDMEWPPRSPDMNCTENAWGELSRRLYEAARQFETVEDLREVLYYEWDKIDLDYIKSLISSMPERVDELRRNSGPPTHY